MTFPENITLDGWERLILPGLRRCDFPEAEVDSVTLLAYFFWNDERIDTKFHTIECAFLASFKNLGLMPSVLVVNRVTPQIERFCDERRIFIQQADNLTAGVPSMNLDCVENLHARFETPYVLIIQSDGLPIRRGLREFVGPYDYVGAPWPGHTSWYDWFPYPKYAVGNGGFTLRSKRICEMSSSFYKRFFKKIPYTWLLGDDVFYCKTMPFLCPGSRRSVHYAPPEVAGRFSVEHESRFSSLGEMPLAFHSQIGFSNILKRFGLPMAQLVDRENRKDESAV